MRPLPLPPLKRLICSGQMLVAYQQGDWRQAECLLADFVQRERADLWMITSYIARVVLPGNATVIEQIITAKGVDDDLKPLLLAAAARAQGDEDRTLAILSAAKSASPAIRFRYADAQKGVFHARGDHLSIAEAGVRFLAAEPEVIHLPFAISVAASAEGVEREDLFAAALSRILADIERVRSERRLLRRHWKDAVTAALTVFDMEAALGILDAAGREGQRQVAELRRGKILAMQAELVPIIPLLADARADLRRRAQGLPPEDGDAQALLVLPAAALRANRIDYPGFRHDLRRILVAAAAAVKERGITVRGRGRIRTHGRLDFDRLFFSYHTYSDRPNGLHFKEADRPHQFSIDRIGYAGWSEFSTLALDDLPLDRIGPAEAASFFESEQGRIVSQKITKYTQESQADLLPNGYIFVALQLIGDAVQANSWVSPLEMLDIVLGACRPLNIPVVVKRHPQCRSAAIAAYLAEKEEARALTIAWGNIHDLIAGSRGVCVQNSGVGAEALVHGKTVFSFGRSDYVAATIPIRTEAQLTAALVEGQSIPAPKLEQFCFHYRRNYLLDLSERSDEALRTDIGRRLNEIL